MSWSKEDDRPLDVMSTTDAVTKIDDLVTFGNPDAWQLLGKTSSKSLGLMKSTKAVDLGLHGCLVQVTTEKGDSIAEAVCFCPGVPFDELRLDFEYPLGDP